ncbi:putative protein Sls1 [Septoria linicola]|nr:putative protein Sls1 [Septoria linicola]
MAQSPTLIKTLLPLHVLATRPSNGNICTRLGALSLDKPASVVVLQDVHDSRDHGPPTDNAILTGHAIEQPQQTPSAQEIERAISNRHLRPDAVEISASLETLRPESNALEQEAFEKLRQQLIVAYTLPQLSRYLMTVLRPTLQPVPPQTNLESHNKVVQAFAWQPGRTAIDTRRAKLVRATKLSRKSQTADRILRLAWKITVVSEEREVGELELMLQPWQMSMLFDLTCKGQDFYKHLLSPAFLVEATEVLTWRPDGILRITGRRRDAEEVAYQLEVALSNVGRLKIDLAGFLTSTATAAQVSNLCSDSELGHISRLTQSVILLEHRSIVVVYNRTTAGLRHARRLILSLIKASVGSERTTTALGTHVLDDLSAHCLVPADTTSLGLHIRERQHYMRRQVARMTGSTTAGLASPQQRDKLASKIVHQLHSLGTMQQGQHNGATYEGGYWKAPAATSEWQAEVVRILQPEASTEPPYQRTGDCIEHQPAQTAVQRHIPGIETVLSYLDLHRGSGENLDGRSTKSINVADEQGLRLIAHLVPAPPFAEQRHLPRIEMHFNLTASREHELHLIDMRAILAEQTVEVPLRSSSVDLLFTRQQAVAAKHELIRTDANIAAFMQTLQESVHDIGSTLSAPPEVVVAMPASLTGIQSTKGYSSMTYLLERFEQTQTRNFAVAGDGPECRSSDKELKSKCTTDDLRLDYTEIEGDSIHGSSSILAVKHTEQVAQQLLTPALADAAQHAVDSTEVSDLARARLASGAPVYRATLAALRIAKLLTNAACGSVAVMRPVQ